MKGVIFDMDGVLFDTETLWKRVWKELADEYGIELSPAFHNEIGGSSSIMGQIVARHFHLEDGEPTVAEAYRRVDRYLLEKVPEKPGLHECLEALSEAGYTLALASSSYRHTIERNLKESHTDACFSAIVSREEITNGKPAPDIFLLAAEKIGMKPEDCYIIEDSLNGIKAAHAAGGKPIMAIDLIQPTEEIRPLCFGIVNNLIEAAALITIK